MPAGSIVVRKVKQGILHFSAAVDDAFGDTFDCQVTAVAIVPSDSGSSADDRESTLGGCIVPSEETEGDKDQLEFTVISDHNAGASDPSGIIAYTWTHRNEEIDFEFIPRLDPSEEGADVGPQYFSGRVICKAMTVGGEVDQRIDQSTSWDITHLELPVAYGGSNTAPTP